MDLTYSPEQRALADSVARYLQQERDFHARQALLASGATWSPQVWKALAQQGVLGLGIAEDVGGTGGSIVDVVAVAERFGAELVGEPFLATVVLAGSVLAATDDEAGRALLAEIVEGGAVVAVALEGASLDGDVLSGECAFVLAGGDADRLLVVADGALLLVDPAADGVHREAFATIDGRGAARIRFDGVRGATVLLADATAVVAAAADDARLYLAAETVGAMELLLRTTASFAATRQQFGVPIGSFQVIAHRLADMKIACVKARSSLLYVTALREADRATARDLAVVKAQTGRLGRQVAEAAVQVHGGVGMTDELVVGHLLKRIIANDVLFGAYDEHLRLLGSPS